MRMTKQEKFKFDEYGTAYPCCGNCESIRRAGFKLMCKRYETFRGFDDIKCSEYSFKEWIPCLFDDLK